MGTPAGRCHGGVARRHVGGNGEGHISRLRTIEGVAGALGLMEALVISFQPGRAAGVGLVVADDAVEVDPAVDDDDVDSQ